jgi:hypothetical protein
MQPKLLPSRWSMLCCPLPTWYGVSASTVHAMHMHASLYQELRRSHCTVHAVGGSRLAGVSFICVVSQFVKRKAISGRIWRDISSSDGGITRQTGPR